ncbi:rod shape-determining protein MreD [Salinihabitans flavidus]|uniref:Rod shape-determining protein MreD n=1 Tax=Salinihabitans flavidus TaxID=569882 RepID=A0A1H8MR67_9RHOB|nr:rod shape-determining protein MreD [Salinihabitans flavidus]SEO19723.1 rod shape-determining protein MreD [Salinihabitans flavidus]
MRLVFVGVSLAVIFMQLLPLETTPRRWTGPDLLVVFSCAWVLRRPDYAPPLLIAAIMLLADFLFLRPPGLFAAVTVIACEALRRRVPNLRGMPFALEWLTATGAIVGIALGNRILLSVFLVDQVPLGLTLIQTIMSAAVYPLVVLVSWFLLGLRKLSARDVEGLGGRV